MGTLFSNDSSEQKKWLDLQLDYFKKTTEDFDHVVRLTKPSETFSQITNVVVSKHQDHYSGLRKLLELFKKNQDYYDHFLFIDSDAFPVRKNWLDILTEKMTNHEVATAIRFENLEQRLHASVLFCKKSAINQLDFPIIKKPIPDLLGRNDNDVIISPYEFARKLVFPLVRSNKTELHPLLCGVYYDMFYHHGCGSRSFYMRSEEYWDHIEINKNVQEFTNKLMNNPVEFINTLIWNNTT